MQASTSVAKCVQCIRLLLVHVCWCISLGECVPSHSRTFSLVSRALLRLCMHKHSLYCEHSVFDYILHKHSLTRSFAVCRSVRLGGCESHSARAVAAAEVRTEYALSDVHGFRSTRYVRLHVYTPLRLPTDAGGFRSIRARCGATAAWCTCQCRTCE